MSLLAMPFLVINFGGEMIYILEQRLHAQNIQPEKSNKVLQDVTKAMFSPKFIAELIKPQEMYSPSATREIFDRLAHSSIMRLSGSSMDKLYDLMTMGFKYQLVSCTHPRELAEVTLNHLDSIREAVSSSAPAVEQIGAAIQTMVSLCREISTAEFAQIRQTLARFFQDKRIKVSLFLQDGIQHPDGVIVLPLGGSLPNDEAVEGPGAIRYYDDSGAVTSTESFVYPLAGSLGARLGGDPYDPRSRDSKLGRNLYTVDRQKKREAPKPAAKPASAASATTTSTQKKGAGGAAAVSELKSLRDLLGTTAPAEDFTVKLFPDAGADGAAEAMTREITISAVTREELEKTNEELTGIIKGFDTGADSGAAKSLGDLYDDIAGDA